MSLQQQIATAPHAVHHGLLPPPFRCTSSHGGLHAVWVEASGELDLLAAGKLEVALCDAATTSRLTVLDLHGLTFIDTSGLHVIEDASLRALLHGRRLVVSRAPAHFIRIRALTGTNCTIELLDADPFAGVTLSSVRLVH